MLQYRLLHLQLWLRKRKPRRVSNQKRNATISCNCLRFIFLIVTSFWPLMSVCWLVGRSVSPSVGRSVCSYLLSEHLFTYWITRMLFTSHIIFLSLGLLFFLYSHLYNFGKMSRRLLSRRKTKGPEVNIMGALVVVANTQVAWEGRSLLCLSSSKTNQGYWVNS